MFKVNNCKNKQQCSQGLKLMLQRLNVFDYNNKETKCLKIKHKIFWCAYFSDAWY